VSTVPTHREVLFVDTATTPRGMLNTGQGRYIQGPAGTLLRESADTHDEVHHHMTVAVTTTRSRQGLAET